MPIYAGTDAGSMVAHGRIADEIEALKGIGMSADRRRWARRAGTPAVVGPTRALSTGPPPTWSCYAEDPRLGAEALNDPEIGDPAWPGV